MDDVGSWMKDCKDEAAGGRIASLGVSISERGVDINVGGNSSVRSSDGRGSDLVPGVVACCSRSSCSVFRPLSSLLRDMS